MMANLGKAPKWRPLKVMAPTMTALYRQLHSQFSVVCPQTSVSTVLHRPRPGALITVSRGSIAANGLSPHTRLLSGTQGVWQAGAQFIRRHQCLPMPRHDLTTLGWMYYAVIYVVVLRLKRVL